MLLMFGVGLHFSLDDLLAVRKIALPGALRADRGGHRAGRRRWRMLVGLEPRRGAGVRAGAVGGQHGGAAARAGEPGIARHASTAASRSAGWWSRTWRWCWCWCCCRRWRGCAGRRRRAADAARAVADARHHAAAGRRLRRADAGGRAGALFPWLLWQVRAPARASCSRCAWWRPRSASPSASAALFGVSFALGAFFAGMVLRESRVQPPRGRGIAAAARRLRGAVLRLGRHAVRPDGAGRAAAAGAGGGGDHRGRQVAGGLRCWCCCCATRCTRR